MSDETYAVVFRGKITQGQDEDQVKQRLAQMFRADAARIEKLFSGRRMVIKKGVDEPTAKKYRDALLKAGAMTSVVRESSVQEPAAKPARPEFEPVPQQPVAEPEPVKVAFIDSSSASEPEPDPDTGWTLAEPGVILVEAERQPTPHIDTSDLELEQVGVMLVEAEEVPGLEIDLANFSLSEAGEVIVEKKVTPTPQIDTSDMDMDEPGVVITHKQAVAEPVIDTSALSLAEDNDAPIVARTRVPEPQIDISGLSVEPAPAEDDDADDNEGVSPAGEG